ncbi:Sortase family protein [compost metagenome]
MFAPAILLRKLRFYLATGGLHLVTIGLIGYAITTAYAPRSTVVAAPPLATQQTQPDKKETAPAFIILSGKPLRLVIPDSGIDLPIDEGFYNETSGSWTLSDSRLQYAMITTQANNHSGNTFIYGHGTDQVLGSLANRTPADGSIAYIHTDTGRVFMYTFQSARSLTPNDTSVFNYSGPPILTVQTCTGSLSEWRTLFTFKFEKVA